MIYNYMMDLILMQLSLQLNMFLYSYMQDLVLLVLAIHL